MHHIIFISKIQCHLYLEKMWAAFLDLQKFIQRLYPLHCIYNEQSKKFHRNQKRNMGFMDKWANTHILLFLLITSVRILNFLNTGTDNVVVSVSLMNFGVDLFFFVTCFICLSFAWTAQHRQDEAVLFLNLAMSLKKP